MSTRVRVLGSSVGTKILIGVTGLFLVLYLMRRRARLRSED